MRLAIRLKQRISRFLNEKRIRGTEFGESIDIDFLIAPLRYDVLVRVRFAEQFRDNWGTYKENFWAFLNTPEAGAYYCWFKEVCMTYFQPEIARDDRLIQPLFIKKVHQFAELWQSIKTRGYQRNQPISLNSGHKIVEVNGKKLSAKIFVGDGCHRMACLYLQGYRTLAPTDYDVVVRQEFRPLDNTSILCRKLPLKGRDYVQFLARRYCKGHQISSVDQLRDCVARENPQWSIELESVLKADLID